MLPLLEEAAKRLALSKFEEVKETLAKEASLDQVHALVSSDQLAARSEGGRLRQRGPLGFEGRLKFKNVLPQALRATP